MDFNKQLRFGLRKSRIYGTLCSAVLGAFIMAGPIVHADEAQPLDTTTEAVSTDTNKTATLATDVVTDHASQTAILATENTRVADTTVANTTTENTETSPYVSDKAIAAAKEAFDNIDTSKALTAEDIKVPETLTTEQEGITETLKERYDDLPAPVRSVTKKVIINDENNGSLGATYSVSGIVTVNAHYFHENNPRQTVETLYHEVGHAIDGATYKKTATGDYSLSRDEAVQPLLKTAYPGYANYEAFASLFGTYMLQETGQKEIKTATDAEIKKYFDVLLNGFTRPTENKYTKDLIATVNSLKANGKTVVYDGLVHVTTPEQAQKENQATIARLTNARSRRSLSTLTRYTAAVPKSDITVTVTTPTTNHNVIAKSNADSVTNLNAYRNHTLTVTASGTGELDDRSYIDVTVTTNLPTDNKSAIFKKDFEATGQFDVNATNSQTTAKLSLAGLKAGVQKDFLIQTNSFNENTRVAEKTIKTTTYKVIIDGKLVETKTITDSYVPYIPTINKSANKQSFKKVTTRKGVQNQFTANEDTSLNITQRRPYGIIDIQVPKDVILTGNEKTSLETYKHIENETAHYLVPQTESDNIRFTYADTHIDADKALTANPDQKVLNQEGRITYYYSDSPLSTDLTTLKTANHVDKDFNITTTLATEKEALGDLKFRDSLYQSPVHVLNTTWSNYYTVTASNGSPTEIKEEVPLPSVEIQFNAQNKPIATGNYQLGLENNGNHVFDVYNADTNQKIGVISNDRLTLPKEATRLRITPQENITVGYGPNATLTSMTYNIFFNATDKDAKAWKTNLDTKQINEETTIMSVKLLGEDGSTIAESTKTLRITNELTALKLDDDSYAFFTPIDKTVNVGLPIRTTAILKGKLPTSAITKVEAIYPGSTEYRPVSYIAYSGPIEDASHRPSGGDFVDTRYDQSPGVYSQLLLDINLPQGNHAYNIPVRLTTAEGIRTVTADGHVSANNVTEAVLHIVTYDAKSTGTESIITAGNVSGSNVTIPNIADDFSATTYVNNFTDAPINQLVAMSYIPKAGIENSTASATLTGPVTAPANWKVTYTTDTISGNYQTDRNLTYTDTVSDYSKVTALKFTSTTAVPATTTTSFTLPLHFNGDIDHNLVNYRSVLLTNDKELLSTPVTATAATGNIVYNYVNKKTNTVIKSVNGGKHFTETPQTHTFENEVTANGKTYKRVSDKEPNTVTIVTKQGTTTITRYYESANPTTVTIKYVFDDTDENTNLFLAGQLPSGNEHTGDFNLGIAPTHTEIDAESSKTFNGNNKPNIDITPDIGYTANPTRFVYSRHTVEASTDLKTQLDKAADTLVSDKTFTLTGTGANDSHTTITYYYKIASGSITQHFVDVNGNKLAEDTTTGQRVADTDVIGISRPERLTKDGKTYRLIKTDTQGTLKNTVLASDIALGEGTQTETVYTPDNNVVITYTYDEIKGQVIQHFVDENGNSLKADTTTGEKPTGETITLTHDNLIGKDNKTYVFVRQDKEDPTQIPDGQVDVTYVYKEAEHSIPNDAPQVDKPVLEVTRYVTDKGIELQDAKEGTQPADKTLQNKWHYDHTEPKQDGITTHVYTAIVNPTRVNIYYVFDDTDENTNLFLAGQLPSGNEHAGSLNLGILPTHTTIDEATSKTFDSNHQRIISIAPDIGYTTEPTRFVYSRYHVDASSDLKTQVDHANLVSDTTTDTFKLTGTGAKNSEITITYYYKIASGSITQHYVDTNGNTLANDTTTGRRVAETDIVDIKRPDQLTKDGYTYRLKQTQTQGSLKKATLFSADLTVGSGTTTDTVYTPDNDVVITYVYEKLTGSVHQRFVDENDNTLKPDTTTGDKPTGESITLTHDNLIEKDNKTYVFTRQDKEDLTSIPDGSITITYVYKEAETSIPNDAPKLDKGEREITRYVTDKGVELQDAKEGTQPADKVLKDKWQYDRTEPKKDGVTTHVYVEVQHAVPNDAPKLDKGNLEVTRYVTDKGVELQDAKEGTQPADKVLKDKWQYDHTEPKKDGVTTHVYVEVQSAIPNDAPKLDKGEREVTRYVTDKGVELQDAKDGTQPADKVLKDKWQYDHTEPKKDGVTTHVYVEVQSAIPNDAPKLDKGEREITRYVTDKGVELQDAKEGTQPADKILKDKWQYDHTEPKKDGVTTHVYVEVQSAIPNDAPKLDKGEREITRYVTNKGVELQDAKEGTQPADKVLKDKWQYNHTEPKKDGITTHVYVAIQSSVPNDAPKLDKGDLEVTRYVTDKGVELQDAKEGTQPADKILKDKWQYNHTEPKKDGITTHVYVEVQHAIPNDAPKLDKGDLEVTRYVTDKGVELQDAKEGTQPADKVLKDKWQYNHTEPKKDGITTHVYVEVQSAIPNDAPKVDLEKLQLTRYITVDGDALAPEEKGLHFAKHFDGYVYDHIEKTDDVITHVYRKVIETPKVPEQPKIPEQPKVPEQPKEQPNVPEQPKVPTTPTYTDKTLPQTGDEAPASLLALGTLILGGLGLASTKRRKED